LDVREYNRDAWDRQVKRGCVWTIPASHEEIEAARVGKWRIVVTPNKSVPQDWLPDLNGKKVLCLASGGGQQGPILAAAGARVTVLDNSPAQLGQDKLTAERENLKLTLVEGDMRDLRSFPLGNFDYIVHPVANTYIPELKPLWAEAFRVLRPGGTLISGFSNPIIYAVDWDLSMLCRKLVIKHPLPYSDLDPQNVQTRSVKIEQGETMEFSHTLTAQIGGQIEAGFMITGFYEDRDIKELDDYEFALNQYMDIYIATRAVKPALAN
jgi:SAM-dependent methyltransferase